MEYDYWMYTTIGTTSTALREAIATVQYGGTTDSG